MVRLGEEEKAWQQAEPININARNLRHAQMYEAVLVGASLRGVDITGAYLHRAHLQGASFYEASLQDAVFKNTHLQMVCLGKANLQSAYLGGAYLQGADLREADLQGADLREAKLQNARLHDADLQGAILSKANLQGAKLIGADLQGADLSEADLQGADLSDVCLEGAILYKAKLFGAILDKGVAEFIDARDVFLEPIELEKNIIAKKQVIQLRTCLAMPKDSIMCDDHYDAEKHDDVDRFRRQLNDYLGKLACESPHIAWGLIQQASKEEDNFFRQGLGGVLKKQLTKDNCKGLQELKSSKRKKLDKLDVR